MNKLEKIIHELQYLYARTEYNWDGECAQSPTYLALGAATRTCFEEVCDGSLTWTAVATIQGGFLLERWDGMGLFGTIEIQPDGEIEYGLDMEFFNETLDKPDGQD